MIPSQVAGASTLVYFLWLSFLGQPYGLWIDPFVSIKRLTQLMTSVTLPLAPW